MSAAQNERMTHVSCKDDRHIHMAFIVKNDLGAVHFHFRLDEEPTFAGGGRFSCEGVETHYADAPDYMTGQEPSHECCWVLGKPCWHDGTSLWASEHWVPGFRRFGTDWVWSELESLHRKYFSTAIAKALGA